MMRYWNQNWLCGPGSYFHGPLGMVINLAFWLAMIVLAVWLLQTIIRKKNTTEGSLGPQEVLKHRYAAGEINREEFERMKKELQG